MAQAPAHRFGQLIGDLIERALHDPLAKIARRHGLYLDFRHSRPARLGRKKVAWKDNRGNLHDLDYVFEAGGTEEKLGRPKAFIEIAYRRYTKHSRNKAQEVQAAILPLAETFSNEHPFLGVVLAGVFTEGALNQLRSHGFGVLYFPFASIVAAFRFVGIDAEFDQSSSDREVQRKVDACLGLRDKEWSKVVTQLRRKHQREIAEFLRELEVTLTRTIETVFVVGLHGRQWEVASVDEAVKLLGSYDEEAGATTFYRYEINVRYTNGDELRATFSSKPEAIRFLEELQ